MFSKDDRSRGNLESQLRRIDRHLAEKGKRYTFLKRGEDWGLLDDGERYILHISECREEDDFAFFQVSDWRHHVLF